MTPSDPFPPYPGQQPPTPPHPGPYPGPYPGQQPPPPPYPGPYPGPFAPGAPYPPAYPPGPPGPPGPPSAAPGAGSPLVPADPLGMRAVAPELPPADDVARRTHPRTILANVFTTLLAGLYLLFQLELDVNQSSRSSGSPFPRGAMALIVIPVVVAHFVIELLRWRAFTYRVGDHRLVIDKGLLTRHHIVVPYDRVQQVDIDRRLTAMILGLATVRIDTAGMGDDTSVHLKYLDPRAANGLRSFILAHRDVRAATSAAAAGTATTGTATTGTYPGAPVPYPGAPVVEHKLVRLGPARLVVAALTHHSLLVLAPVVVVAGIWALALASLTSSKPMSAATTGVIGLSFMGVVALMAAQSLLAVVVNKWGFELSHSGDDLHLRFGLTDQRHLTVPRRRIQHIEIIDNPIRRALGLVGVDLHTAAAATGAGEGGAPTRFEIPVLRRAELDVVLPLILGDPGWRLPALTPRPPAARRRAIVRRVAVVFVALLLPAFAFLPLGPVLLLFAAVGVPWGIEAHRRAGYARTPSIVVLAHGVLHHRIVLVPADRVQSQRATSSPFQRLAGTKTLHLDVARAPRAPSLFDIDADHVLGA